MKGEKMTVKLYEGCYGITRGGQIVGPMAIPQANEAYQWNIPGEPRGRWDTDGEDGHQPAGVKQAKTDITAVYATRAEAEAALAKAEGKTLEQITRETCDEIDAIFAQARAAEGRKLQDISLKEGDLVRCVVADDEFPEAWTVGKDYPVVQNRGVLDNEGFVWANAPRARFALVSRATAPAPDAARDERSVVELRAEVERWRSIALATLSEIVKLEDERDAALAALEARQ